MSADHSTQTQTSHGVHVVIRFLQEENVLPFPADHLPQFRHDRRGASRVDLQDPKCRCVLLWPIMTRAHNRWCGSERPMPVPFRDTPRSGRHVCGLCLSVCSWRTQALPVYGGSL